MRERERERERVALSDSIAITHTAKCHSILIIIPLKMLRYRTFHTSPKLDVRRGGRFFQFQG